MRQILTFGLLLLITTHAFAWQEVTLTKTETLGSIAEKYRPKGVSRMDMVIAIRNANPHVFSSQDNFKPGVKLEVPTTVKEVRQAITGKLQVSLPAETKKTLTHVVSAAHQEAHAVSARNSKEKAKAPVKTTEKAIKKVTHPAASVKTKAKATSDKKSTVTVPSSKVHHAKAVNQASPHKPMAGAHEASNKAAENAAIAAKLNTNNARMQTLENTISSQKQMLNAYQEQLQQLTGQLNTSQQKIQSLEAQLNAQPQGWWSKRIQELANLWLLLWCLTLLLLLYQYWQKRTRLNTVSQERDTERAEPILAPTFEEPILNTSSNAETAAIPAHEHEPVVAPMPESWEQVELDIPINTHVNNEPGMDINPPEFYTDKVLAGEQQHLINAIASDLNNIDWHRALLEFYIKTNNQNGFKRHYQSMLTAALMQEGDPLWEEVRKLYLNKWIYALS